MKLNFLHKRRKSGWNSESGCTGLEIAGLVASVAGSGLGVLSSSQAKDNMNQAANAELMRQQDFAKKGKNVFEQSLQESTPDALAKNRQAGALQAVQEYQKLQGAQAPQLGLLSEGQVNPNERANATENTIVGAQTARSNNANAALQGWNTSDVAQSIKDLQARGRLGQIGAYSNQSASLLPLELNAAQHSEDGLTGLGSLLNTAGGLASTYGSVQPPASNFNFASTMQPAQGIPFNNMWAQGLFNSPLRTTPYF